MRFHTYKKSTILTFILIFAVIPAALAEDVEILFDMGPDGSPAALGSLPVTENTIYSKTTGYGWVSVPKTGFDDESGLSEKGDAHYPLHLVEPGKALYRDGFEDDGPIRFRVDVPSGEYLVTVFVGRYQKRRHDLRVRINGTLVAENVDAWGKVWGSQGGTPVKSVKVPVAPKDGIILIEVDYAPSRPDSWKEYTTREPEDGRLWYLGENKSSILGVHLRTAPQWSIKRQGPKLIVQTPNESFQNILDALNDNNVNRALDLLDEYPQDENELDWILMADTIASHIDTSDEMRIHLLKSSIQKLCGIKSPSPAVRERLEVDERVLLALETLRMWNFQWAREETDLNCYHRYWSAYELCNSVPVTDPLYSLALLIQMRVSYWNGREGGWKHCYDLGKKHARALCELYPGHELPRMYLGESIRHVYGEQTAPETAPRWAVLQREALGRLREVIYYWVKRRQSENGELGGGWGDDVEILRSWIPLVLAVNDPITRLGAQRIADGVLASGVVEHGYSKEIGDVEHAAEPVSDTQPLMMAAHYGDPKYFETCLETMRCMKTVWTALNDNGDLHFKSHYFSASETVDTIPRSADTPLNGRAAKPGAWVMWYSGHPVVRDLLSNWSMAWVNAGRSEDRGKPVGILPGSVSFPDGRIGGYADHWWQTKGYNDFTAISYTRTLYHIMLAAWAETGNDEILEPILAALDAIRVYQRSGQENPKEGSLEWVGKLHDTDAFYDVLEKWRVLSGDDRYDDLLLKRASGAMRYRLTGDSLKLEHELEGIISGLSHNLPMITTEVLFTDRVSIPGNAVLTSMLTGSFGNPTYYPVHAVTWNGVGDEAEAFVTASDTKKLEAQLYVFSDSPAEVGARFWRLENGTYEVSLKNPASSPFFLRKLRVTERGIPLQLTLPPHQLTILSVRQIDSSPAPEFLPDLAIGLQDIERTSPQNLKLTVHNIGTENVPEFSIRIATQNGWEKTIEMKDLKAPLDLIPKSIAAEIEIPEELLGQFFRIDVDPGDEVKEINESNNVLKLLLSKN